MFHPTAGLGYPFFIRGGGWQGYLVLIQGSGRGYQLGYPMAQNFLNFIQFFEKFW